MSLKLSKCDFCKYYHYDKEKNYFYCDAYPDGIPYLEINDDDYESECNNGIKFEEE